MPIRAYHSAIVVVEDLDEDVCLYRPDIDEVVVLNATAGDVWRLSDGELTLDEVVSRLASVYQVPPDTVRPDIHGVFMDLLERGYLSQSNQDGVTASATEPTIGRVSDSDEHGTDHSG